MCRELGVPIVPGGAMQQPLGIWRDLEIWRSVTKAWSAYKTAKVRQEQCPDWAQRVISQCEQAQAEMLQATIDRALSEG